MSWRDREMLACSESKWKGDLKCCRWCNAPLEGRQIRWCYACNKGNGYGENHWWTSARAAAVKRDGNKCVRCGAEGELVDRGTGWSHTKVSTLQVHHKTPILGKHSVTGCHHHLSGLETLCKDCHLAEHHPPKPEAAPSAQLQIEAAA